MRIFIVFGGPSLERAISLNSARSLADHLYAFDVAQSWVFVSENKTFHFIDKKWLYCNTVEDFEFKLTDGLSWEKFERHLTDDDIIFSALHGAFGEDGEFSSWLESAQREFIGPSAHSCQRAYLKENALSLLTQMNLAPGPYICLKTPEDWHKLDLFMKNFPPGQRFFMKPNAGGSSIGARPFGSQAELKEQWEADAHYYRQGVIVEPFYENAQEFCLTLMASGHPDDDIYCLPPVVIDYGPGEFYDYRKKYLLSDHSHWECPASWPAEYLEKAQKHAKEVYKAIKARGAIRIDGWLFECGRIAFSDINLISGFEQNSLLFRQAAVAGLSHEGLCQWLVQNLTSKTLPLKTLAEPSAKKNVFIVFGGNSSERYTSMLSAINVWLKLLSQKEFEVVPYLWEPTGGLRPVPYYAMLSHGLQGLCEALLLSKATLAPYRLPFADLSENLGAQDNYTLSLPAFLGHAQRQEAFVFLALHGGDGENGVWQSWLTQASIPFNGSGVKGSAVSMDKQRTAELITAMGHPKIKTLPKLLIKTTDFMEQIREKAENFHQNYAFPWVIKPRSEGCSAGVMVVSNLSDLLAFFSYMKQPSERQSALLSSELLAQWDKMEYCLVVTDWLIEPMVSCDKICFSQDKEITAQGSGWVELTQGVLQKGGEWQALAPSLVIPQERILTLEEKFQSGTGTNVTPVPFFTQEDRWWLSRAMIQVAESLEIQQYARIDLFYHRHTRDIIIIEANTLPGLTASTVLFHQLILEGISPQQFFAWLVDAKNQPARLIQQSALLATELEKTIS